MMRPWLIEYRQKAGLSQADVAIKCGISRQYYSFIESGDRNCTVRIAKKIANVLGFPWEKFYAEEEAQ